MATSLQNIIAALKETALLESVGIKAVQEKKINMNSNPDTLLPLLKINMNNYGYSKFLRDSAVEDYNLELVFVMKDTSNPISDLKTLIDIFLNKLFNDNILFTKLSQEGKIALIDCDMSNNRDVYSKLGGEFAILKMKITNTNNFGGSPCL